MKNIWLVASLLCLAHPSQSYVPFHTSNLYHYMNFNESYLNYRSLQTQSDHDEADYNEADYDEEACCSQSNESCRRKYGRRVCAFICVALLTGGGWFISQNWKLIAEQWR